MSACLSKTNGYNGSRRLGLGFKDTFSKEQENNTMSILSTIKTLLWHFIALMLNLTSVPNVCLNDKLRNTVCVF